MTMERRKYVRFLAKKNSFAALRDEFKKVGKIDDISINGLGFSFLGEIAQDDLTDHHTQVDIFSSEDRFHISSVPCRIAYEIPDATPDEGVLVRMSRYGLQFGDFTGSQLEQLELFIKNYTTKVLDT